MTSLTDLPTPTLIVDLDKLEANILSMATKCRRPLRGRRWRPVATT